MSSRSQKTLQELPKLEYAPPYQKEWLFLKKLNQCCVIFNFEYQSKNDPKADLKGKEIKRAALEELAEHICKKKVLTEAVYPEIIRMISTNLFRPIHRKFDGETEEGDFPLEASWPHLELVYDFFFKFLSNPEFQAKYAKNDLDKNFVMQLLELFDSEDKRERRCLKSVLLRIYYKFFQLRPFILKEIEHIFLRFAHETQQFSGIVDLLENMETFIEDFEVPFNEEQRNFLLKVLIPLHKTKHLPLYCKPLIKCVVLFIKRDSKLTEPYVREALKYWPRTSAQREELYLEEIGKILDVIKPSQFLKIQEPLFKQMAKSLRGPHAPVCKKILQILRNEYVISLVIDNDEILLPLIFFSLYKLIENHWDRISTELALNVLESYSSSSRRLYEDFRASYAYEKKKEKEREKEREKKRAELWKRLEQLEIKSKDQGEAE